MSPRTHNITSQGFANWDADWYVRIAREGYGYTSKGYSSYPFFPLLPAILRAGRAVGVAAALTGVVISHVAFLIGLWGVYVLARRRVDETPARLAVWSLALFPSAAVFSTPYPSSMFLAASTWAFVMVDDGRDVAAAALAMAVALVRPNGVVVAISLVVAVVVAERRTRTWRRAARRAALIAVPPLLAVIAWMAILRRWTGDALVFLHAKRAWEEITVLDLLSGRKVKPSAVVHLALALTAIAALVIAARRLPFSWHVFTGLYLVPAFVLGVVGMGRYTNECFPLFVAAGVVAADIPSRLRTAGLGLSAAVLAVFGGTVAAGRVVP